MEDGGWNTTEGCLLFVVSGRIANAFDMGGGLTNTMRAGGWVGVPSFQLQTCNTSEVQEITISLHAGALPAHLGPLGEDGGTSSYISPSQGKSFRFDPLITNVVVMLAVAGVVFIRYDKPQAALPMIVIGPSKMYIFLGFVTATGYPFDPSVITDFTAVVGIEVDDLIIIADEVTGEGSAKSRKVLQSRSRRASWVTGAVAVTTIITMSPFAALSLDDFQDFTTFTILGVIVGVLVIRPVCGDIL